MQTAAGGKPAAVEKQHLIHAHRTATPTALQPPREGALSAFIGTALRALRDAAGLAHDRKSLAKIKRALLAAREAIDSALWAVDYATELHKRGER
jgi:hypothetical protein